MIRRAAGDSFWLITQVDHARFAGLLAASLSANGFTSPNDDVKAAIAHHDDGWSLHDDRPALNDRGLPLNVFEISMGMATKIWSESVERAAAFGSYAKLLVSLHQLALADFATRQSDSTPHERARNPTERFELNKFQHRQVEIQESLRRELNMRTNLPLKLGLAQPGADAKDDQLAYDFQLLTLCDRLSLQLCMGEPLFPKIEMPRGLSARQLPNLRSRFVDEFVVEVTPFPFASGRVASDVPAKRVSATAFESEAQFQRQLASEPTQSLTMKVQAG